MILSEEHQYLFLQVAHTGSTGLGRELIENYGGHEILRKHARLREARDAGVLEGRALQICAGIRNPLDVWVTRFMRMKTNHGGSFTNPRRLRKNGGFLKDKQIRWFKYIQEHDASFSDFVRAFPDSIYIAEEHVPYTHHFIRFEHLQADFKACIEGIGLSFVRPLPHVNPTKKKAPFWTYFDAEAWAVARESGGAMLARLGYEFPDRPEDYADLYAAAAGA